MTKASFLTIPLELRYKIYGYLIPSEIELAVKDGKDWHFHLASTYEHRPNLRHRLRLTNKQIEEESEELPNPVHFARLRPDLLMFSGLGAGFIKRIRQIRVGVEVELE
jgi:hypothetical protein